MQLNRLELEKASDALIIFGLREITDSQETQLRVMTERLATSEAKATSLESIVEDLEEEVRRTCPHSKLLPFAHVASVWAVAGMPCLCARITSDCSLCFDRAGPFTAEPAGMPQLRAKSAAIVRERQDLMATISQLRHELNIAQHQQQPLRALCSTAPKFPAEHDPMAWFSQPSPSLAERDGLAIRHEAATPPDSTPKARGVESAAAAVVARAVVGAAASPAPRSPQPSAKAEDDLDSGWMHFSLPSTTSSYAMHSPESWSASRQACAPCL